MAVSCVKCGGRPRAAWSSASMEGPALIIKNTFTGRISAASVVDCSLQGHIQDNHTEEKFGNIAQNKDGVIQRGRLDYMAAKHPELEGQPLYICLDIFPCSQMKNTGTCECRL